MSSVYKAQNLVLNRTVAIKILSGNRNLNEQSLMRFQQEARAASQLDHPGIVKVHDFSVSTDQTPYMVMDYVEGNSISELIANEGPMDSYRAIDLVLQACDALGHAHLKNVVHRDLKPSNIMVTQQKDGSELAKIVDFGVAKFLEEEHASSPQLTRTGEVFGSPLYMSPEQCLGKKVDARSDIYSLACVLYEELTGMPPFRSNNLLATMQMHIADPPPELTKERSDLPNGPRLSSLLLTALAKNPDQRFQTMHEFAGALKEAALKPASGFFGKLLTQFNIIRQVQGSNKQLPLFVVSSLALLIIVITTFWAWQSNQALQEIKTKVQSPEVSAIPVEPPAELKPQRNASDLMLGRPSQKVLIKALKAYDPPKIDIKTGININNEIVPYIIDNPNLKVLYIRNSRIDGEGFKKISKAIGKQLLRLSLSGNRMLQPKDMIEVLNNCPNLIHISAQGARTNDDVVAAFSKFKNLQRIEISWTDITADAFSKLPVMPSVRLLMINNTPINADTFHDISEKFPNLEELHMSNTRVTDADLTKLKTMHLKHLYVSHCRLTDTALDRLIRDTNPDLEIHR